MQLRLSLLLADGACARAQGANVRALVDLLGQAQELADRMERSAWSPRPRPRRTP